MARQKSLNLYGKGIHKTKAGHLRYHSPKELNNKYVHRVVADRLIAETPYSIRLLLPCPFEVHHMDYNKENNEPHNLLLLDEAFHSILTADRRRNSNGWFESKFYPKWKPKQWVDRDLPFSDDEVPF